jgi:hypothetical protein
MIFSPHEPSPGAEMFALSDSEHLLVWTWRRIAAGRGDCPLIPREFTRACGEDAAEVFVTFCTFLRALGCASRRLLRVGPPGSATLTRDERQLLSVIAAAQAGDDARGEAHLRWLARAELRHALAIAANALGAALAAHGHWLPQPDPVAPVARAQQAPVLIRSRFRAS